MSNVLALHLANLDLISGTTWSPKNCKELIPQHWAKKPQALPSVAKTPTPIFSLFLSLDFILPFIIVITVNLSYQKILVLKNCQWILHGTRNSNCMKDKWHLSSSQRFSSFPTSGGICWISLASKLRYIEVLMVCCSYFILFFFGATVKKIIGYAKVMKI